MKQFCILSFLIYLLCPSCLLAQDGEEDNVYNSLKIISISEANTDLESVLAEKKIYSKLLSDDLKGLLEKNSPRTMAILIRDLNYDVEKKINDKKYKTCSFRVSLFEETPRGFYFINTIDTLLYTKDRDDLPEISSTVFSDFIQDNLQYEPFDDGRAFSYDEVMFSLDELEKINIPLFAANAKLPAGIYNDFHSLSVLEPSSTEMKVEMKKGEVKKVKIPNPKKGSKASKNLNAKDVYAFVFKGELYISVNDKFIHAAKLNNDFCFITYQHDYALPVGLSFGIGNGGRGGLGLSFGLGTPPTVDKLLMKIDHINGKFIFVKQITN